MKMANRQMKFVFKKAKDVAGTVASPTESTRPNMPKASTQSALRIDATNLFDISYFIKPLTCYITSHIFFETSRVKFSVLDLQRSVYSNVGY